MSKINLTSNFLLAATLLLAAASCIRSNYQKDQGMVWNTLYNITYDSPVPLTDSVTGILSEVGRNLNFFDEKSLLSEVNTNCKTAVNRQFADVYLIAAKVSGLSQGAYDPTFSPLFTAWGFGKGHQATSDTLRLDSLRNLCGIAKTRLLGDTLVKDDPRIEFNFSSVAKGYGCDEVGRMLKRNGCDNYLVEIGGEIAMAGNNPKGSKWRISIDKPTKNATDLSRDSQMILELTDCGVATSGNYRNYHETSEGQRYGHTLDTATGRPATTDVLSATVVAATSAEADALATAAMAMDSQRAIEMLKFTKNPALLILNDGTLWISESLKPLIVE